MAPQAPLDKVYWINAAEKKIQRASLDGSAIEDVVCGLGIAHGLAIDPDGEHIYWIDLGRRAIQRACHDGSQLEDVICDLEGPAALALGPLKIYWADRKLRQILCANLNGARVAVVAANLQHPNALALDSLAGKLYWGDYGTKRIHRVNLDGSCPEDVVPYGKNSNGIVVDSLHGKLFWANFGTKAIYRANLNGTEMEPIVTQLENPNAIALGQKSQRVYWIDRDAQKIQRASLDGSGVEDVVSGIQDPWGVVLGPESEPAPSPLPSEPDGQVVAPAELHLRVLRQELGAAPISLLFDPASTGRSLIDRMQDLVTKPVAGKEVSFFFTNPGGTRTLLAEPWKTLQALGVQDGADIEVEIRSSSRQEAEDSRGQGAQAAPAADSQATATTKDWATDKEAFAQRAALRQEKLKEFWGRGRATSEEQQETAKAIAREEAALEALERERRDSQAAAPSSGSSPLVVTIDDEVSRGPTGVIVPYPAGSAAATAGPEEWVPKHNFVVDALRPELYNVLCTEGLHTMREVAAFLVNQDETLGGLVVSSELQGVLLGKRAKLQARCSEDEEFRRVVLGT